MIIYYASSGVNFIQKGCDFMARRSRESLSTSFFHVIVQGINKEYIFERDGYNWGQSLIALRNIEKNKFK